MRRPRSAPYLGLALALLLVEILIALFVHDRIVRPHIGDLLVVVLIYCLVAALIDAPRWLIALGVFVFACAVEAAQYARLLSLLGLEEHRLLRVVLGTDFDPWDILAYFAGAALSLACDRSRPLPHCQADRAG